MSNSLSTKKNGKPKPDITAPPAIFKLLLPSRDVSLTATPMFATMNGHDAVVKLLQPHGETARVRQVSLV